MYTKVNDLVKQFFDLFLNVNSMNVSVFNAYNIICDIVGIMITGMFVIIIAMLPFIVYRGLVKWLNKVRI